MKDRLGLSPGQPSENDGLPRVRAVRNYVPTKQTELQISIGDNIILLEKTRPEWWKGELNGVVGYFPADYVVESKRVPAVSQQTFTTEIEIEGYLNKRSENTMMKSWQKRWGYVKDGKFGLCQSKVCSPLSFCPQPSSFRKGDNFSSPFSGYTHKTCPRPGRVHSQEG